MPDAGDAPEIRVSIRRKVHRARRGVPDVEAVRDLAFALAPGETVCMIGPSGAGKTTALRVMLGLDRDFEGEVRPDPRALPIGIVFQDPRLLPWRTVEANVRVALPRGRRDRSLDELLAELGLERWRRCYPGELSLGMARRVALARALALEPSFLVLDEPFVSLDDQAAAALRAVLFGTAARRGTSVLMVTHNVAEALDVADRLILLTPRPASLLAEVPLPTPRADRDPGWIEATRRDLAARYPDAVAA